MFVFFFQDKQSEFEFPNIFEEHETEEQRSIEKSKDMQRQTNIARKQTWKREDIPVWFR